jgi:hypothetical protein
LGRLHNSRYTTPADKARLYLNTPVNPVLL